jgi:spore maturation protein CgeB
MNHRILFQLPHESSIYAGRTIHNAYKNAAKICGYEFKFLTANDNFDKVMNLYEPTILFTSSHFYYQRYLDEKRLLHYRKNGLFVVAWVESWISGIAKSRINEGKSLKDNKKIIKRIKEDNFADLYISPVEQYDLRMVEFEAKLGVPYKTVPLAADSTEIYSEYDQKYVSDICFIGTNLPQKKDGFKEYLFPLKNCYDLKIYGQDWNRKDKLFGWIQKAGQLLNIKKLAEIQKPKLEISDERKIYSSSAISVNIHENYQVSFGGDCNERTFKIPMAGGFQVCDDINCLSDYFKIDEEIITAKNSNEWYEKIDFYWRNPELRIKIAENGMKRVCKEHTYVNRIKSITSSCIKK